MNECDKQDYCPHYATVMSKCTTHLYMICEHYHYLDKPFQTNDGTRLTARDIKRLEDLGL